MKNAVITIDATPFRTWFEAHYKAKVDATPVPAVEGAKESKAVKAKFAERQKAAQVDPKIIEQFATGRLLATLTSRPGQSGRADGQILEGSALDFYQRKILMKKTGKAKVRQSACGAGGLFNIDCKLLGTFAPVIALFIVYFNVTFLPPSLSSQA